MITPTNVVFLDRFRRPAAAAAPPNAAGSISAAKAAQLVERVERSLRPGVQIERIDASHVRIGVNGEWSTLDAVALSQLLDAISDCVDAGWDGSMGDEHVGAGNPIADVER